MAVFIQQVIVVQISILAFLVFFYIFALLRSSGPWSHFTVHKCAYMWTLSGAEETR